MFLTATVLAVVTFATPEVVQPTETDFIGTQQIPDGEKLTVYEGEMLELLNAHRVRHGRAPVVIDWTIQRSARNWAHHMANVQSMYHGNSPYAENVAWNQRDPRDVTTTWIHSGGHNANMLRSSHRRVGLTGFRSRNGSIYWVQQFSN